MKSIKKLLAALLIISAVFAVYGCGQSQVPEGEQKQTGKLHFEIPEGTVGNPYNGTFSTWEFYTDGYGQPGVDILVSASYMDGKTIDQYVKNESRPSRSKGVSPFKKEKINGQTWYTCNNGTIWYFASTADGENIYEIEVKSVGNDPQKLRDLAIKMLYKTLRFE